MLEQALAELTKAVARNNELQEIIISKIEGGSAKTAEKPAATSKADAKGGETSDDEKPTRASRASSKTSKAKAPTTAEMSEKTKAFLEVEDEQEYKDRRAFVKKIVEKFEVDKMSEVAEADRQAALDYLVSYAAGDKTDLDDEDDLA